MNFKMVTSDKRFAPFFWTQFWGAFNDNFFKNALVIIVAYRGVQLLGMDYGSLVAVAGGLLILPFFLFSPIAGQLSDKYEKSKIVRATKKLEIFIMLIAAFGFFLQSYLLLLGLIFLMGTQSAFFGPVKYSIIPELVDPDTLTEGNALTEFGTMLSILLGTIAGGAVTSIPGADPVIGVGLVVFAILGFVAARKVPPVTAGDPDLKLQWNPFPVFGSLWKILRSQVAIFNTVLAISWFWFFGAGVLSVLPVYVKDHILGNENVATLFLAMFTLGVGVGSILCEKLSYKRVEIGLVPIGSLGLTLFVVDLFLVGAPWEGAPSASITLPEFIGRFEGWRLMFDFFMMSVSGGLFIVPLYTLLQERSESQSRSRVIAATNIMNALFMVVASLVLILFYRWDYNPAEILLSFAIMNVVVAIYIYTVVPEFTLRFYSWVLSRIVYSIETKGIEHIPKENSFVLVSNHVTYVDWLILAGACKRPVSYVMYYKFFKIPLINLLMRQARVIPIASQKEDPEILEKAFVTISSELNNQTPVCIFPEGTLTDNGKLKIFKPGVTKIIEKDPVPVVPVVIHGLYGSIFSRAPRKDRPHRRKLVVEFFPPIPASDVTLEKLELIIAGELNEVPPHQRAEKETT